MTTTLLSRNTLNEECKLLEWHRFYDNCYIRKIISLKFSLKLQSYDYTKADKDYLEKSSINDVIDILKKSNFGMYDKIVAFHGIIAINFNLNTMLQLKLSKTDATFNTYCLICGGITHEETIVPIYKFEHSNFHFTKSLINLCLGAFCLNCTITVNKYFKWEENEQEQKSLYNRKFHIRKSISFKKSLAEMFNSENSIERKQKLSDYIKVISTNKDMLWINDTALIEFNVIAVDVDKQVLLILNVIEPYKIRIDEYFFKCGHYIKGQNIKVLDNCKINCNHIKNILNSNWKLDCDKCFKPMYSSFISIFILFGLSAYFFNCIFSFMFNLF